MKVLYYYYYLFYKKIMPDADPHETAVFTLSISQAWLIFGLLETLTATLYCKSLTTIAYWFYFILGILLFSINYYIFIVKKKSTNIIKNKPKFFNSNSISIYITVLFWLISISFFFVGAFYVKDILAKCK